MKEIVWEPSNGHDSHCLHLGGGLKLALPAWLASMTHEPAPVKATTPLVIEQTLVAEASIEKIPALPDGHPTPSACK